jgi:DNA-binding response OmpR family regulator
MGGEVLEVGSSKLCVATCTASRKGHSVRLGAIECRMLETLVRAKGAPVSRQSLAESLWGDSQAGEGRIRGVAMRLRAMLRHSHRDDREGRLPPGGRRLRL